MISVPDQVDQGVGETGGANSAMRRLGALRRSLSSFSLGSSGATAGILVMCALYIVYMFIANQPRTLAGFSTIIGEAATVGLAAVGEAIVVLSGGFDLSAGAAIGVVNVIVATRTGFATHTFSLIIIGLGVGIGIGILNGLIVALLRVPPIIATLGTLFIWEGVALLILPQPGGSINTGFVNTLGGSVGSVPIPLILFAIAALVWRVAKFTKPGRHVYMLGGDTESTRANGVNVRRTLLFTYGAAGFFYALAGLYFSAATASGNPDTSSSLLLPIFAAVVLGGILFGGGKGDPAAAIIGALTLTLISDVLYAFGVSSFYTAIFDGAALIVALALGVVSGRLFSLRRIGSRLRGPAGPAGGAETGAVA